MTDTPKRDEYERERDSWDSEVLEDADGGLYLLADAALAEADEELHLVRTLANAQVQVANDALEQAEATIERLKWMLDVLLTGITELGECSFWYEGKWPEDDYISRPLLEADLERRWEERDE